MAYHSIPQIIDDWTPDLLKNENILDEIKNDYKILYGNVKLLFSKNFLKGKMYDKWFLNIYKNDRINSNYPKEFLIEKMNELFRFMGKKVKIKKALVAKNEKQVRNYLYKICKMIDKLNQNT